MNNGNGSNKKEEIPSDLIFKCNCSHDESSDMEPIAFYDKLMWQEITQQKKLPLLNANEISYREFFTKYLVTNIPCLFSKAVTDSWLSRKFWVMEAAYDLVGEVDVGEMINFDYLLDTYGNAKVSAVNCDDEEYRNGYATRDCRDMLFMDYVKYWKYLIKMRKGRNESGGESPPCFYLKDWHIVRYHKSVDSEVSPLLPYELPIFFQSDWLNEVCDSKNGDDFKFCYMGPKGSFTSFHADVYGSYSWSANIVGVKRWYLYPPGKEQRFMDPIKKRLNFNWDDPGIESEDFIEVVQNAGECLFVPSGWHHVVWNLTDAISINHNWFNGANICYIWRVLQKALKEVEDELDDIRDIPEFHKQCQLVLRANHGMNFEGFIEILDLIKETRESRKSGSSDFLRFDLDAIRHAAKQCASNPIVNSHFADSISKLFK